MLQKLPNLAVAQQRARQHRTKHAEDLVTSRSTLAFGRVASGAVAVFVAQHPGQFRLIVHQRDQLAGGVDIAAGSRERVVDGRVEQGHREIVAVVGHPRLQRDLLADAFDIKSLRPGHRSAEFGHQLRVVFGSFLLFLGGDRHGGASRRLGGDTTLRRGDQRKRGADGQSSLNGFPVRHLRLPAMEWNSTGLSPYLLLGKP